MELPLHPKIVHLPIALAVLMPLLTSGLLLAIWRDWFPRRVWTIAVVGSLLLVGSGVLALRSGEADEERVERFVPEAALERHEEAAERFVWASALLLGLSLAPLLLGNPRARLLGQAATVAASGVVLALGFAVGQAGGELVYGHNGAAAFTARSEGQGPAVVPDGRAHDDER